MRGGDHQVHLALVVLRLVVVPLVARDDDLADERCKGLPVPEHADLDLDARDELLDEHLLVMPERKLDPPAQLLLVVRLCDADRGAETGGLDEHGVAERVLGGRAVPERDVPGHGYSVIAQDGLEQILVHADG